jgi:hypothetical protein
MASKRSGSRGPESPDFSFRAKLGVFEWGGVIPDGTPGLLPPNRLRAHVNGRYDSGILRPRGGVSKLLPSPLTSANASIKGLVDFQPATRRSLYVVSRGCPGLEALVGFSLGWFDLEQEPQFQSGVYYDGGAEGLVIEPFSGSLLLGQDNVLRTLLVVNTPFDGDVSLDFSGSSLDRQEVTFAGIDRISALKAHDGRVLVALDDGAGASKVVSWDGVTVHEDGLSSINPPTGMGLYQESAILGYDGSPNHIRVRPAGSSPQTWATVNPNAGTAAFKQGVSFRNLFWFTTGGEDLYTFNGTNLTRIVVGVTGIPAGSATWGICVFEGFLFVVYTTSANVVHLARYDGSAWVASHKNLTAQFALLAAGRSIAAYRGGLVVTGIESNKGTLYFSPGTATSGTWTKLLPNSTSGEMDQLVAF